MKRFNFLIGAAWLLISLCACSEEVGSAAKGAASGGAGGNGQQEPGTLLIFDVPAKGPLLIDLDGPTVLSETAATSADWELQFGGYDVLTNSGVSGAGMGGAFGPLEAGALSFEQAPEVPFVLDDRSGGALLNWYAYDGATHALWSRYHVYGVRDGADDYKVQILSYYGELEGAPVSAVYQLRWAAVTANGVASTQILLDLDGTAGGLSGGPGDPSECLDLANGDRQLLTVDQALKSNAWHLCFRRDSISVNGELGGPRGVKAVDVSAPNEPEERPLDHIKMKTADSELVAFAAVDHAALHDPALVYRGDRVVSAFDTHWYQPGAPPTPTQASWYVRSSDGARAFLVRFESFQNAAADTPGRVTLRVKKLGAAH